MPYQFPRWIILPETESLSAAEFGFYKACRAGLPFMTMEESLKLTPWERLERHDKFVANFMHREELSHPYCVVENSSRAGKNHKSKI
jgi:hypothetical protein